MYRTPRIRDQSVTLPEPSRDPSLLPKHLAPRMVQPERDSPAGIQVCSSHPNSTHDQMSTPIWFGLVIDVVMWWVSPLGQYNSPILSDAVITDISSKLDVTPGQVILAWGVQRGVSVLPKSSNEKRLEQNINVSRVWISLHTFKEKGEELMRDLVST